MTGHDRRTIYLAAGARSLTTGFVGVSLGLYLAALSLSAAQLGLVVGLGLAGNALATALVAVAGERLGRRTTLVAVSVLSAGGFAALALSHSPALLGLTAFLGMVNGMGRDRGAAQAMDQSLLADRTSDAERTAVFTRYTLAQDVLGTVGSLAAGAPALLERFWVIAPVSAYRWAFAAGAALSLVPVALYASLPAAFDVRPAAWNRPVTRNTASRRRLAGLSALFALDSIGGGLIAGSILAYWFFRRFGMTGATLGPVFAAAKALNALSYLAAQALARRFGLLRTMVWTHLPSSLVLLALPLVGSAPFAVTLFLLREALVQMDVPTRQSYVAAVTAPGERTFALAITSLVRNLGWAVGPALAGVAMGTFGLGAPLVSGAAVKIGYDLGLYGAFRTVRPPEERDAQ